MTRLSAWLLAVVVAVVGGCRDERVVRDATTSDASTSTTDSSTSTSTGTSTSTSTRTSTTDASTSPSDAGTLGTGAEPRGDGPNAGLNEGLVVFETAAGDVPVEVEIAQTDEQRRVGLMNRRHLAPGKGMIFLMPHERIHTFWMKNTLIPLDMIFVTAQRRVAGVVADTEPLTLTARHIDQPSRYVVEVPGGFAAASGIQAGDRVRFEGVPLAPPPRAAPHDPGARDDAADF